MARTICIASAKGGTGKTVVTTAFATILAHLGRKVLIIDADAATSGLTLFFLQDVVMEANVGHGLYEDSRAEFTPTMVTLADGMHLLPSAYRRLDFSLNSKECLERLQEVIDYGHSEGYDFILIDAQAGSDVHAQVATSPRVSDTVVLVTEFDPVSAAGIETLKTRHSESFSFERTWLLVNKTLPEFSKSYQAFFEVWKHLLPIPWYAEVVRAYSRRKLALNLKTGNQYTFAMMVTLKQLLEQLHEAQTARDIDEWMNQLSEAAKMPIAVQIERTRTQIKELRREEERKARLGVLQVAAPFLAAATVAVLLMTYTFTGGPSLLQDVPPIVRSVVMGISATLGLLILVAVSVGMVRSAQRIGTLQRDDVAERIRQELQLEELEQLAETEISTMEVSQYDQ